MLNERIKELRNAMGISQVELANRLSVSKQTVSNWENNNIQPSVEMLQKLSDLFGASTDYLLGRTDIPTLNVDGLSQDILQHLNLLIQDLQRLQK